MKNWLRKWLGFTLLYLIRFALWFRYRVTIKGLDQMNPSHLNKKGGVLFLPNHPTFFVDPTLISLSIWTRYPIRPVIVEYMFYAPVINKMMRFMNALPIPEFIESSNSLKRRKTEQALHSIEEGLRKGDNFLIYPAGKTKQQAHEVVSGSGVHTILQAVPEANVVLVRITGLWGSRFSRALTAGKAPPAMATTILWGIKKALLSLLFFLPRRPVTLEFVPAPPDFPFNGSRLEMNRYLENWYNKQAGDIPYPEGQTGEPISLVSYSLWKEEFPEIQKREIKAEEYELSKIPQGIKTQILKKLSEMTSTPAHEIRSDMNLAADLGLDSLDGAELVTFLDDQYNVRGVPVKELTTVGRLMAIAASQLVFEKEENDAENGSLSWKKESCRPHKRASLPEGKTIPEVFLNACNKWAHEEICADQVAGILTYAQAKMRVLLLAEHIRRFPGIYVGILLPSSVAAYLLILACQLAGKIPLLVNWTMGKRHLESVCELTNVKVILSSWAFIDRLENVDLGPIEDRIVLLEDMRKEFTLKDKLKAFIRSKYRTSSLLSLFSKEPQNEESLAVLLFTSGTENMPKGVPLSHKNILFDQRTALQVAKLYEDDILLGILPPFHSFGFTVSGILTLLTGIRTIYSPDPTDGPKLVKLIDAWKATIVCGAPTFLKGIFASSHGDELKSMRLCVSGAERIPEEIFAYVEKIKGCKVYEGYGITECSPIISINIDHARTRGVGYLIPGMEGLIVHVETHEPLPHGEKGLILVRGDNVFAGYINPDIHSPFLTIDGKTWYVTGDLGYFEPTGELVLAGRLKRFIKIGGEMISLSAVEEVLQNKSREKGFSVPDGPLLAVVDKEENGEKNKIVVFVRFSTSVDELNSFLRAGGFSNLVKVHKVIPVDAIPLMGSGKIFYRELEKRVYSS